MMASSNADSTSAKSPEVQSDRHSPPNFFRYFFTLFARHLLPGVLNRLFTRDHPKSIISKPDCSSDEYQDAVDYWRNNQAELGKRYGSYLMAKTKTKKRIPRYYFINNKRTILIILQGDIIQTKVDAVVNAANEHMTGGAGVDGMIHRAAGSQLYSACVAHKQVESGVRLPTGHSRILLSYNMSSTTYYIINTAGPVYNSRKVSQCADQLSSCYKTALDLANLYDLESIGFTAISCGIFGYPANDGADVALQTIDKNAGSLPLVVFVLWDDHIYDAWVKKAEELKFAPFDPVQPTSEVLPKEEPDTKVEKQTTDESKANDDDSTLKHDKHGDSSTPHTPEIMSKDEVASLVDRLPSIPHDSIDSQETQTVDDDKDAMEVSHDQPLVSQNTMEMANSDSQQEEESKQVPDETKVSNTKDGDDDEESKKRRGSSEIVNDKKLH
ncbi:unnamed protein product [Adineta ricciae]|uniref:Macro domain-containing protein n=1 Tax=Adineta ricciae TaxID=249248 RepID=A0A814HYA1_ADIRI|nr:unnamed protein product [Adineta ricciae]